MTSPFDHIQQDLYPKDIKTDPNNPFSEIEKEDAVEADNTFKSIARWLYQIPAGVMQAATYPMDLWNLIGTGLSLDPGEIEHLRKVSEREGIPFDENKYMEAVQKAYETFPTQSNIERFIEEKTGAPFEPKTRGQKFLRFASTATKLSPKGATIRGFKTPLPKPVLGTAVASTAEGLKEAGVPEPIADLLSFAILKKLPKGEELKSLEENILSKAPGEPPKEGYSPTAYKAAEEALGQLQGEEKKVAENILEKYHLKTAEKEPLKGIRPKEIPEIKTEKPIKAKQISEDLGIRPSPIEKAAETYAPENLKERVLDTVSPNEVYNKRQTGMKLKEIVNDLDKKEYSAIKKLYDKAKESNAQVQNIRENLAEELIGKLGELEKIPSPSSVQKQLKSHMKNILDSLVTMDAEGDITGYKSINNKVLIDQIQALRYSVDYDFAHGKPKNIFKPLIEDLVRSVEDHAIVTGNRQAIDELNSANKSYAKWKEKFDNDYINPYRDRTNKDYNKLFDNVTNPDEFNIMRDIVGETQEGKEILNAVQRDIVDKDLKGILKDPKKTNPRELDRSYRELESVLSKDQIEKIKKEISKEIKKPSAKERKITQKKIEKEKPPKLPEKYAKMKPENIQGMMNNVSGIRELKSELLKTSEGTNKFNNLAQHKLRELIYGERVTKKPSTKEIYNILDKKKNYEVLQELTSPEDAKNIIENLKIISEEESKIIPKKSRIGSATKSLFKYYAKYKFLKVFINLI